MIRGSGILLHITSLPSTLGIGDLGPAAFAFADRLQEMGQRYWQILPLSPTDPEYDHSPYHCTSAFALNPLLIDCQALVEERLLEPDDLDDLQGFSTEAVDYMGLVPRKKTVLKRAFRCFQRKKETQEFQSFCCEQAVWLDDYALFNALKPLYPGRDWNLWPEEIQNRSPAALSEARANLADEIKEIKFYQYIAHGQWLALKSYCNGKSIQIIGDLPIYIDFNSPDLWAYPDYFKLGADKAPYVVAGVPPDYFSETGQLWGNPIYSWESLKEHDYDWWVRRIEHSLALFDWVRIDHFRGLVAYWEVAAGEETAMKGAWVQAPARDFLQKVTERLPDLPVIAEDLGIITPDVREIMADFQLPGMRPILFGFDGDADQNPYLPQNMSPNTVAYTGTHDNNTVRGWFETEASPEQKDRLYAYLGQTVSAEEVSALLVERVMESKAEIAIFPMQDLLGLDGRGRMNKPSVPEGNWRWRVNGEAPQPGLINQMRRLSEEHNRL